MFPLLTVVLQQNALQLEQANTHWDLPTYMAKLSQDFTATQVCIVNDGLTSDVTAQSVEPVPQALSEGESEVEGSDETVKFSWWHSNSSC